MKRNIQLLTLYLTILINNDSIGSGPQEDIDVEAVFSCYTSNPYAQPYGEEEQRLASLRKEQTILIQKGSPRSQLEQLQSQIMASETKLNELGDLARNY